MNVVSKSGVRRAKRVDHDPQTLGRWLLTAYLGTAPVYWLPGLSMGNMQLIKLALIASACGIIWYDAVQRNHPLFPRGLAGLDGFYLVVLTCFMGVFRAVSLGEAVGTLTNFVQSFVFLWTLYIFYTRGGDVVRVFRDAAVIVVILSIPPITNWFFGVPGWSYSGENPFWSTGFTNKRSGWSQGQAFYLPIIATLPLFGSRRTATSYLWAMVGVAILLVGQLITGGRTGLLASFVVLAALSVLLLPRKVSVTLFGALLACGFYLADFAYDHLRFHRLTSWSYESINAFSSYRLEDYVAAYDLFWLKPLGHGFGKSVQILVQEYKQSNELHNVWLRLLADGGILLLVSMLLVVGRFFATSLRNLEPHVLRRMRAGLSVPHAVRRRQLLLVVCLSILLAGLAISMFTPRAPIGVFQNNAMWWASAGAIVGISSFTWRGGKKRRAMARKLR